LGRPDGGITRDEAIAHAADLVAATDLPVSADLENGFGPTPEDVVVTIHRAAEAGLAGCSIEDFSGDNDEPIYDFGLSRERIVAAAEAAAGLGVPFVLTARSENFLHERPDLGDAIARLQAFAEAGADVLYAPGLPDLAAMEAVVSSVDRPVNLLADPRFTVAQLRATGAKRISIGSHFFRAAFGALRRAATEFTTDGTMSFTRDADGLDLDALFDPGGP
jgi:2-methylisocitrate lyase-like PEP mutase family enzyme